MSTEKHRLLSIDEAVIDRILRDREMLQRFPALAVHASAMATAPKKKRCCGGGGKTAAESMADKYNKTKAAIARMSLADKTALRDKLNATRVKLWYLDFDNKIVKLVF
jgi:hypothetical protein